MTVRLAKDGDGVRDPSIRWVVVVVDEDGTERDVLSAQTRVEAVNVAGGIRQRGTNIKIVARSTESTPQGSHYAQR
jgi:hypothetical protein